MLEGRSILEAGVGAVQPSAFANINAFTAVVAGLLEISIMEGFQLPEFIADQLMPPDNTKMFAGRKVIGTTRLGNKAEERQPGMPTARASSASAGSRSRPPWKTPSAARSPRRPSTST